MVIRRPSGCTAQFAPPPLVAVLCAVALLAAGCSSEDSLGAGDAATVEDGSVAEYSVDGTTWVEAAAGEAVPADAQVRSPGEEVRLRFRAGLARLSPAATATVTASTLTLERGQVLVDSEGGLKAALDDTSIAGAGQYRLASGLAARVAVYDGEVSVTRPAQEQDVVALRQLDLSAFRLEAAGPLQYRATDTWDRELLADAIAFDGEAARLASGLDSQLGTRPRKPAFYRRFVVQPAVLPVLSDMATVVRGPAVGPPSGLLLPLFIAQAAPGSVGTAVQAVSDLRADGARWGLIALDLDVSSQRVVAAIDALGDRELAADTGPRGAGRDADAATDRPDSTGGSGSDSTSVAAAPTGGSGGGTDDDGSRDGGTTGSDGDDSPGDDPGDDNPPNSGGEPPEEPKDPDDPEDPEEPSGPVEQVVDEVVKTVDGDGSVRKTSRPVTDPVRDVIDSVVDPGS